MNGKKSVQMDVVQMLDGCVVQMEKIALQSRVNVTPQVNPTIKTTEEHFFRKMDQIDMNCS